MSCSNCYDWESRGIRRLCPDCISTSVPFEDDRGFILNRYFKTLFGATFTPAKLFASMTGDEWGPPVTYASINLFLSLMLGFVVNAMIAALDGPTALGEYFGRSLARIDYGFIKLLALIGLCVGWAGLYHLGLLLMRARVRSFATTLRAVSYSTGFFFLAAIPFLGWLLGWMGAVVVSTIAGQRGHNIPVSKAVGALIVPMIPLVLLVGVVVLLYLV